MPQMADSITSKATYYIGPVNVDSQTPLIEKNVLLVENPNQTSKNQTKEDLVRMDVNYRDFVAGTVFGTVFSLVAFMLGFYAK